jgi:hypothetical protein
VHERLVESWLDNASERSYQAPFCQMLSAQGYRIIHSSRHSPIEFGKDIIAIAPDGIPCAYQLKGKPGGRLTLNEFNEIESQLLNLVNMPINDPSIPNIQHRAYLVTNGQVEEEVRHAITLLNEGFKHAGLINRKIEIIQRGDILDIARDLGYSLWPSELKQINLLLEILVEDGANLFPISKLHSLLIELLLLDENLEPRISAAEMRRRICSSAVLVSIALMNYQKSDNHFAIITAWIIFCAYVIAACERLSFNYEEIAKPSVRLALVNVLDSLTFQAIEIFGRKHLIEGDYVFDSVVYRARYTLILSLMSILWFWCEEEKWPQDLNKEKLEEFLHEGLDKLYLWGEAVVPQILCYYWFLRRTTPSSESERLLASIINGLIKHDNKGNPIGLASPYYDYEDVSRHILAPILGRDDDQSRAESLSISYYAEPLMHLFVRTGRKQLCKRIWPALTRFSFYSFIPESKWQYCLYRTDKGEYIHVIPPFTKQWNDLVDEARRIDCNEMPHSMKDNKFLTMLFLIVFPYRGIPSVIRHIAYCFDKTWFINPPIE